MVPLLLLPLLWGGSLQEKPGYELRVQESVRVQEGLCVHVSCSFSYLWGLVHSPSTLYTYWYLRGVRSYYNDPVATNNPRKPVMRDTQGRFLLADPRNNNCSLSIRDARISDTGTYLLRVERGTSVKYSYQDKKLSLQVTALTEKPNIHIPEPLEAGCPTQLTCSLPGACEGGSHLTFSWVGGALDSVNPKTPGSSVLTFTPRPQDHGTNLTCLVTLVGAYVTTQRSIRLNVSYAPRNFTIGISFRNVTGRRNPAFLRLRFWAPEITLELRRESHFQWDQTQEALKILQNTSSLPILEGEAVRLFCEADSNPPAELSWFRGSPALNATPISSTANLELPRMGTVQEGEFSCLAQHPLGSQTLSLSASPCSLISPQLLGPSCSWEDQGLHFSCSSRAQSAPSLRWRLGAGLLEGNHSNASCTITSLSGGPWVNSSLSLSQELSTSLSLSSEASNVHGAQSAAVLLLPGRSMFQRGVVPAALGGAGVMALLSLCLCLLFLYIVRAHRKPAAGRPQVRDGEDPVVGTATWGFKQKPGPHRPPDQVALAGDAPPSGEKQELQGTSLSFHEIRSLEPQDQEATSSPEYSEIKKTSK